MTSENNKKYFIEIDPTDDVPTENEICVAIDEIIEDVNKDKISKESDVIETLKTKSSKNSKLNSKNKKIIANIAFVMLLFVGTIIVAYIYALLVVVEGEVNRAEIIAEIEKATGRKMNVNSRITFESIPVPKFIINGISIKNKDKTVNDNFMEISSLEVHPSLLHLVLGNIKITDLNFINTTINIENFISGNNNFNVGSGSKSGKYMPLSSIATLKEYLNVNKINIKNLNVNLYSGKKEKPIKRNFNLANISFVAESIKGPYKIAGNIFAEHANLNFDYIMDIGKVDELSKLDELPVLLKLSSKTANLNFAGSLTNSDTGFEYKGAMDGVLDDSIQYLRKYLGDDNVFLSEIIAGLLVDKGVGISSDFKLTNKKFVLRDFKFNETMLDGVSDLEMIFGRVSKVNLRLKFKKVDFDSIIEKSSKAEILSRSDNIVENDGLKANKRSKITDIGLPEDINIRVKSDIQEILYKNKLVKNFKLDIRAGSYMAINKIEIFSFPGGGNLRGGGKVSNSISGPKFDGKVKVAVKDLKDLLNWYNPSGNTKANIGNKIYRDFYLNSDVSIVSDKVTFPNLSIGIDGSKINGRMTLSKNKNLIVNSTATVTNLNLNKYNLFDSKNTNDLNASYKIFEFLRSIDNIFESLTINLNADKVSFKDKEYNDFSTVASFAGGISKLVGIKYDVDGNNVNGSIKLDNKKLNPEVEIVFDFDSIDQDTLLAITTRGEPERTSSNIFLNTREFSFSDLNILRGKIRLTIKELRYGKLENDKLDKLKISMIIEKDKLKINNLSAKAFKGNIRFVGGIDIGSRTGGQFNYYLTNIEFRDFASTLFNIRNIEGRINSNGQISVSGNNLEQWIKTMTGSGALVSRGISFHGFNTPYLISELPKIKKSVRRARFAVNKALSTGKTTVSFLSGGYQFYKGKILLSKGYRVSSGNIHKFNVMGDINLINKAIDVSLSYKGAGGGKGRNAAVYPFRLKIGGSFDYPRAIWDQKAIVKTWENSQY